MSDKEREKWRKQAEMMKSELNTMSHVSSSSSACSAIHHTSSSSSSSSSSANNNNNIPQLPRIISAKAVVDSISISDDDDDEDDENLFLRRKRTRRRRLKTRRGIPEGEENQQDNKIKKKKVRTAGLTERERYFKEYYPFLPPGIPFQHKFATLHELYREDRAARSMLSSVSSCPDDDSNGNLDTEKNNNNNDNVHGHDHHDDSENKRHLISDDEKRARLLAMFTSISQRSVYSWPETEEDVQRRKEDEKEKKLVARRLETLKRLFQGAISSSVKKRGPGAR